MLGAKKGQKLKLVRHGRVIDAGAADAFGSKIFRELEARRRVPRACPAARSQADEGVQGPAPGRQSATGVLQAQEAQAGPQLRDDARRRGARDDGAPAAGQDPGRRAVPHAHRVLGLPDRRAARPAPVRRSTPSAAAAPRADPLAPATSTAVGSLIAPAASASPWSACRCAARAARAAPSTSSTSPRPTTATTRWRRSPRRAGSRAARSAWPASPSPASPSSSSRARGPRTWRPSPRCRSPTTSTPGTGYPGGIFNSGFAAVLDPGAHGRRQARARRRPAVGEGAGARQGDKHCIANQRLRLQTPGRARAPEARTRSATPSLFDAARARGVAEARQGADVPRRPVPGRADRRALRRGARRT